MFYRDPAHPELRAAVIHNQPEGTQHAGHQRLHLPLQHDALRSLPEQGLLGVHPQSLQEVSQPPEDGRQRLIRDQWYSTRSWNIFQSH